MRSSSIAAADTSSKSTDRVVLSGRDIRKTFRRGLGWTNHLQDHLLRGRKSNRFWRIEALRGVSIDLREGEWLGVYGSNGSGKTTLLRILAGLMAADSGVVECSKKLSYFFSFGTGLHPEFRAEENLYLYGLLHGISRRDMRARIEEIISFAQIESHRSVPIKCYSVGMQLRLGFAATVHIDADIYLFDEVVAVGDEEFQRRCLERLHLMKVARKPAMLVSHSLSSLRSLCDRILFLEDGRIVGEEVVAHALAVEQRA